MARFARSLFVMAVTIFIAPLIFAASLEDEVGQVLFLEKRESFLRGMSSDTNEKQETFSREDAAATIAVLLGVPPPSMLSSASSAKLDSVISSNPFNRPGAVLALTIRGITLEALSGAEISIIFKSPNAQQRLYTEKAHERPFILSGQDVMLESLNNNLVDDESLERLLQSWIPFLGGTYHKEAGSELIVLTTPSASISLDLKKNADRVFARDLVSLFKFLEGEVALRGESKSIAKLFVDSFSGVELMDEKYGNGLQASKLFLYAAVRIMDALEATVGQIVGVLILPSSSSPKTCGQDLFQVKFPLRSSRSLEEDFSNFVGAPAPSGGLIAPNSTELEAQATALVRRSLVLTTAIILIIATLLGTCYLVGMPLTRDTLLYSGVKLD